jgi:hypothetical protein
MNADYQVRLAHFATASVSHKAGGAQMIRTSRQRRKALDREVAKLCAAYTRDRSTAIPKTEEAMEALWQADPAFRDLCGQIDAERAKWLGEGQIGT